MKRNYFLETLLLALMGSMGSGCNNIDEPTRQTGEQRRMVTLSAQAEISAGTDSRVAFNDNSTGIALTWENGDEITVASGSVDGTYSTSGDVPNVRDFLLTATSSTATFTGDIAEADTGTYYAFYPRAIEIDKASDWNKVPHASFDLSTQSGSLDESLTYMAAFAEPDDLKAVSFPFSHLTTVLKITPTITGVSEGTTITDVKILGNSGSQAWLLQKGKYTIDSSNQIKISNGNYGSISITGECKTGTAIYCYLVGGDYDNLKITATVNGTSYCGDIIGSTATALKSGKAYTKNVEMELAYTYDANTDVYTPHTSAGLQAIVATRSDANITLKDDIILPAGRAAGGTNWTPLTSSEPYTGIFDGNGKTISGLICPSGSLIGNLGIGGVVKNLTLENCNMNQAAFVYTNEGGTISDCTLKNSAVTGFWHPGGIVSFNKQGTVSNCTVTGCYMSSTYGGVGGVAGENGSYGGKNKAVIQDCSLIGENTVDAYSFDGAGIVISNNHDGIIRGCSVSGDCSIKSKGTGTAGIVSINYGTISYCFVSSCNISRKDGRTSSIAGIATGNVSTITACYVYGVTTNDNAPLVATANIIGYSGTSEATVNDCYYVAAGSNAVYSFDNSETPVDWATALSAMNAASNDYVWGGDSYDSATLTKKKNSAASGNATLDGYGYEELP